MLFPHKRKCHSFFQTWLNNFESGIHPMLDGRVSVQPSFGEGIFLVRDVADILRLPYRRVRNWMNEFWDNQFGSESGTRYAFGQRGNRAINFYTLVEFYTYYQLREQGVGTSRISGAHTTMAHEMETPYPFAAAEEVYVDGRKRVWYKHLEALVCADGKSQIHLEEFVSPFLRRLEFDDNGLASRFFPLDNSKTVVIDPKHQFGQPTVRGTNIRTATIYELHRGGESTGSICKLYDLTAPQVQDAITYHELRAAA